MILEVATTLGTSLLIAFLAISAGVMILLMGKLFSRVLEWLDNWTE